MSEIPEDVLAAAQRVVNTDGWTAVTVARAILAERKRCAEIARHLNGWGPVGGSIVAEHIAKTIEASQ